MNYFEKNLSLYPVLASLCGLTDEPHNRGFYAGECKPGSGLNRRMLSFDNLARIGSEKGDRAEIERINGGTYALPVGQPTIISRDLPVGDPWLTMRLNLRGQLRDPGVPATGTVRPDAPLNLFDIALTTDIDRDVVEPAVSARALYRYNQFLYGTAGAMTAATLPNTNTTLFNAVVDIPFVDPLLRIPMDTVLDTRRYNAVTLTITTGTILALLNAPAATTVLESCFVDIEIVRVSPRVPMPLTVAKALPFFKRHAPIVPMGDTTINLDRVPTLAIKRLCAFTSNAAAGTNEPLVGIPFTGLGVNTMVAGLRVSSNFRDHFGSSLGGVLPVLIQAGNKLDYSVEAWPAGWYVVDFNLERSLWNALATGDKSTLQAIFTWNAALANILQTSLLVAGIQKLRNAAGA
jgi:hypothetical protein